MSLPERIEALQARHAQLERELDDENLRPQPDGDCISRLKRAKLRIKDELQRLDTSLVTG